MIFISDGDFHNGISFSSLSLITALAVWLRKEKPCLEEPRVSQSFIASVRWDAIGHSTVPVTGGANENSTVCRNQVGPQRVLSPFPNSFSRESLGQMLCQF